MSENIKSREEAIGKKAAKMAQNYVHQVLRQNLNIRNKGGEKMKPILQATKVEKKMGDHRLLGLNFTSSKVGFILHYGFVGARIATTVYYNASRYKVDSATRARQDVNMPGKHLFEDIYTKSGALDYLFRELSQTRGDAFQIRLNNMIVKFNSEADGRS